jgi:hypothetical protein
MRKRKLGLLVRINKNKEYSISIIGCTLLDGFGLTGLRKFKSHAKCQLVCPQGWRNLKKHFAMTDPVVVVGNDGKYFQVCHWERFEGQLLDLSFVSTVHILEQ